MPLMMGCARKWLGPAVVVAAGLGGVLPASAVEGLVLNFDPAPKKDTYALTVVAVVDAPALAVRHTLLHICDFKDSYAYMKECVVFNVQDNQAWSYARVTPPVLDPRDYISRRTVVEDLKPDGTGALRIVYAHDHRAGPPPREGIIRVEVNEGHWELTPVGNKTKITYALTLNPGGVVPIWMARLAARRAAPAQLESIEKIARAQQAAGKVDVPVPGTPWADVKAKPLPGAAITER